MSAKDIYLEALRLTDAHDERFFELQAPECTWQVPGATLRGRDEVRAWVEPFWTAFSTTRHDIVRLAEHGNTVFAEGVLTARQDGPMATPAGEVPATGNDVRFGFAMTVVADEAAGWATEVNLYFDQLDFLAQLGALPEPAGAV